MNNMNSLLYIPKLPGWNIKKSVLRKQTFVWNSIIIRVSSLMKTKVCVFLATLVALHLTPVSESVGGS